MVTVQLEVSMIICGPNDWSHGPNALVFHDHLKHFSNGAFSTVIIGDEVYSESDVFGCVIGACSKTTNVHDAQVVDVITDVCGFLRCDTESSQIS